MDRLQLMIDHHTHDMPIDEQSQQLRDAWPEIMELTDRVGSVQQKIIQSSKVYFPFWMSLFFLNHRFKAAVAELFRDDILTRFYQSYAWASRACALRVSSLIDLLARQGKHIIRVLEVGAGTSVFSYFRIQKRIIPYRHRSTITAVERSIRPVPLIDNSILCYRRIERTTAESFTC